MPLTLVLGPANSAKAGEVLGSFEQAAPRGALLVVPTAADVAHYGRELAQRGAVLGTAITFSGLAREIARRTGYASRRISSFQRERLLRRVAGRLSFEVLAESAGSAGFAPAAAQLIAELERTLVTPQRFAQALSAWADGGEWRGRYASDLAALYRTYVAELDGLGRDDAERHAWRALDALRAAPGRWGSDAVFFYGFDDLTALERDAVETLARIVGAEVTVSLTYEPGRPALAARAEAVEELRPLAARIEELPALDEHYQPAARDALHHLERSLFEASPERIDPGDAVLLAEAGGERAEAELIAAEVLSLRRAGVAAEEIVVVCRSLERSGEVLERVFAQYGLPVSWRRRVRLTRAPLGRALLALARCAWARDSGAADLISYLRLPGLIERPELIDRLELEVRQEGIRSVAIARERLGWELREIDSLASATDPAAELARQARRLLSAPNRGQAPVLEPERELDARALAALLRALDELGELGEHATPAELLELLVSLELDLSRPPSPGSVLIAEPLGIRARRFHAVFVCGLQEGEFPRPAAPDPFLPDERRRELAAASGLRLALGEDSVARERYLFYACVSRATGRLVLSYRSSDEEGNIELASPFIADVEELLAEGWRERRRRRLLSDVVWEPAQAPTARELERSRAAASAPLSGEPELPTLALSEAALAHVRHSEVVSAGALEKYADCPVRWLVERELAPEELESPSDAMARGSYMHWLLEELLRRLDGPVTAATLNRAEQILEELLSEQASVIAPGRPEPLRAAALQSIAADARRYLRHEASDACGWTPVGLERRFGFEGEDPESLPAVALHGAAGERVLLRGVIDRIDADPSGSGGAIVRDYKSGSSRPEQAGARWEADRQLQVALYMLAVRQLLGLRPVAGFYQPLGGNDLRPRGVFLDSAPVGRSVFGNDARSEAELEAVIAGAEARAVAIAARLRRGELERCPTTCSRDGCRYPGICRSQ